MTHEFAEPPEEFEETTGLALAAKLLEVAAKVNESHGLMSTIAASMLNESVTRTMEVNDSKANASILMAVLLLSVETMAPLARAAGQELPDALHASVALIEAQRNIPCPCGHCD